ncbi:ribosome assembly RNA-binding protein YhbY [Erysipelatoclostridium sp. AM42-17]|uniref:ribosome assembly RNA-binding protein YhbY n=1 Tax=Erysipelatoclostridium sp. AM42-17 TaxID=2293102 RepID=UPI000E473175|nr:ribosome assembly RNA-binding protein YhbY [Erysipelatoclostridium sp. AM42-17]RHS96388.1 ribosome assembly RNA-binding protein YhbY [Erysipelatoclostridium sp. AM42-17]
MLTGKQKRYLRSEAHHLSAIFQIGKDGVHRTQIEGITDALDAKELIKVKILESCSQSKNEVALELSMKTKADVVQILGRTIILYKPSDKEIYRLP